MEVLELLYFNINFFNFIVMVFVLLNILCLWQVELYFLKMFKFWFLEYVILYGRGMLQM